MSKIIGGILATSLAPSSAGSTMKFLAEQILKAQTAIVSSIKNTILQREKKISSDEIDHMLEELENNSKCITTLMKYNYTAAGKIQTTMSLKASAKQTLSHEQIEVYRSFNETYGEQSQNLLEIFDAIDNQDDFNQVQKAILSDDDTAAYDSLKTVTNYQYEAIIKLHSIVDYCTTTLALLQ